MSTIESTAPTSWKWTFSGLDRVDRAHLVEVDLLRAGAVDRRLHLGQPAEELGRALAHLWVEAAAVDAREDRPEPAAVAGVRRVVLDDHVELRRAEARAHHALRLEAMAAEGKPVELRAQLAERQAEVEQRAEQHVARGAGRRVEIGDPAQSAPRCLRLT
jgi:hypothetical protein